MLLHKFMDLEMYLLILILIIRKAYLRSGKVQVVLRDI